MKTFLKKNALFVFALLLAAGTMSFKSIEMKKTSYSNPLWHWKQNTPDGQNTDYTEYEPATGSYGCLSITSVYCVIEAPEDPAHPGFPDLSNITVLSRKN